MELMPEQVNDAILTDAFYSIVGDLRIAGGVVYSRAISDQLARNYEGSRYQANQVEYERREIADTSVRAALEDAALEAAAAEPVEKEPRRVTQEEIEAWQERTRTQNRERVARKARLAKGEA